MNKNAGSRRTPVNRLGKPKLLLSRLVGGTRSPRNVNASCRDLLMPRSRDIVMPWIRRPLLVWGRRTCFWASFC